MKTILICPNQANGIPVLADSRPTAGLPFLGESFLCYWLEQLASRGVTEVRLVTSDEVDFVEKVLGNGTRWGINLEIFHEVQGVGCCRGPEAVSARVRDGLAAGGRDRSRSSSGTAGAQAILELFELV